MLTREVPVGTGLRIPINHFEGNYTCDADTLAELRAEDRVVLRYVDNPNGSVDDIAGVCNAGGNVVGLMPHPERASDPAARLGRRRRSSCGRCSPRPVLRPCPRRWVRCRSTPESQDGTRVGRARRPAGPVGVVQLRVRGILACWSTEALTPTVRQAE